MNKPNGRASPGRDFSRLKLSPYARAAFDGLLATAPKLGLDPHGVAAAGLPGLRAVLALKQAAESTGRKRDAYLAQLQGTLQVLRYREHPQLVQELQARAMALQGRGGDTEVAHVTAGEIVIPRELQTPDVMANLQAAARAQGIDVSRYEVGNQRNSINPATWEPEFFGPSSGQNYCQLPDGQIVPYSDLGLGYVQVEGGGENTDLGSGVGVGHAGANSNWPTEARPGGLAGGGESGRYTSIPSRVLRNMTDAARFPPLRPLTGTASVGGSIARAFPVIGSGLMLLDYLKTMDDFENAPICKPTA